MRVAIDIGGTNTRIGASHDGRHFFAIEKFKTPKKFVDGMQEIKRTVLRAVGGQSSVYRKLHGVAIAVPGPIDAAHKKLLHLPNLPGWRNKPIVPALSSALHTNMEKIFLINDADAAGVGEARRGAGQGYRKVLYLTISTGIGGARIVNGALDPAAPHFEPGHWTLVPHGKKCGCGRRGCFEAYGSGTAFRTTYGLRTEACTDTRIWKKYAATLGQGIINSIRHAPPDVIIVGGGVSKAGARLFTPLRAYIKKHLPASKLPKIARAKLGDLSGLYGCLALLR